MKASSRPRSARKDPWRPAGDEKEFTAPCSSGSMTYPNVSQLMRARNGLGYLTMISIQFGVQPILVKQFINKQCMTSSVVLCAELSKVVGCLLIMFSDETAKRCFNNWRIQDCLLAAGLYT
eukprot:symbB.v1.2.032106.t1/scaffold3808.1/size49906/6